MRAQYILQPCTKCGAQMKVSPSQVGRKKYCSRACQYGGHSLTKTCLHCGKEYRAYAAYSERSKFCSRQCSNTHVSQKQTKVATITRACSSCGKPFQTTQHHGGRLTCSQACANRARGRFGNGIRQQLNTPTSSKIEEVVARWLTQRHIPHVRHVAFGPCVIDIQVGRTIIEVNGCYWHACPLHTTGLTVDQQRRRKRDAILKTELRKAGYRLIVIWEHDINQGDFSVLHPLLETR